MATRRWFYAITWASSTQNIKNHEDFTKIPGVWCHGKRVQQRAFTIGKENVSLLYITIGNEPFKKLNGL
jgi:hypothetical protein